jgi:hypothetical protein
MAKISNAPRAQLRTAKFKKAVFIVDDLVLKVHINAMTPD